MFYCYGYDKLPLILPTYFRDAPPKQAGKSSYTGHYMLCSPDAQILQGTRDSVPVIGIAYREAAVFRLRVAQA
jgi:hypothetical protein